VSRAGRDAAAAGDGRPAAGDEAVSGAARDGAAAGLPATAGDGAAGDGPTAGVGAAAERSPGHGAAAERATANGAAIGWPAVRDPDLIGSLIQQHFHGRVCGWVGGWPSLDALHCTAAVCFWQRSLGFFSVISRGAPRA
jgi:hypothetical protein